MLDSSLTRYSVGLCAGFFSVAMRYGVFFNNFWMLYGPMGRLLVVACPSGSILVLRKPLGAPLI